MYPSVRDDTLAPAFPSLKSGLDALGFTALELDFGRDRTVRSLLGGSDDPQVDIGTPWGAERFKQELAKHGYRVSAFLLANNFGETDLDGEIRWVIDAIKAASHLGVPVVRIDAIMQGEHDMPLKDRAAHFAGCMGRILDATSDAKVDCGIENHGFQGNDPDFLDMVLDAVDSPRVGMTLDTGNFYWSGHPLSRVYEILEHFATRTKHTHVKNINYPAETRETRRELGWEYGKYVSSIREGDIDHARVVKLLKSVGYDRDLCLEDESLGKWNAEERAAVLKDDADLFREIL